MESVPTSQASRCLGVFPRPIPIFHPHTSQTYSSESCGSDLVPLYDNRRNVLCSALLHPFPPTSPASFQLRISHCLLACLRRMVFLCSFFLGLFFPSCSVACFFLDISLCACVDFSVLFPSYLFPRTLVQGTLLNGLLFLSHVPTDSLPPCSAGVWSTFMYELRPSPIHFALIVVTVLFYCLMGSHHVTPPPPISLLTIFFPHVVPQDHFIIVDWNRCLLSKL